MARRIDRLLLSLLGCSIFGGLEACDSPQPQAPASVTPRNALAAAKDAGAVPEPEYVYQFNPMGRRDPFRAPADDVTVQSETGAGECSDPLCQWDLDQLTLVAVVTGEAEPIAMVEDPSGRGHIVRRNSPIGKQDGRVTQILRGSLVVTEYFVSPDGKKTANPVSLGMKASAEHEAPMDLDTGRPYAQ